MNQNKIEMVVDSENLYTGIINIYETFKQNHNQEEREAVVKLNLHQSTDLSMVEKFVSLLSTVSEDFNYVPVIEVECV